MRSGRIVKALSGFYYVKDGEDIVPCRARGHFKHENCSPLVGDYVRFSGDGMIEEILPRKNSFIRPAAANLDALVFVASLAKPVTDPFLIDRVSVIAAANECEMILCVNKSDLRSAGELADRYRGCGFTAFSTSAVTGEGIDALKEALRGKTSAFTGNSGVGKSSLLNCLIPEADAATDNISDKLGRGKHTTRHVELFFLQEDTAIADTPGYASFEIAMMNTISRQDLPGLFPDFSPFLGSCRFLDCSHNREPGCAIKEAVSQGKIHSGRYDSYLRLYEDLGNLSAWD